MDSQKSEQLIKDYCRTLATAKDRSLAARERDRLRFFLHAYVAEEWPRDIDRVDSEIIRDFLGAWFPRHVGGSRTDITSYLSTFRRFYDHLYHAGQISAAEYDELAAVLASRQYFLDRFDDFFRPAPDAWEDFAAGGPVKDGDIAPALEVDRQLWMVVNNLDHTDPPGPLDFSLFLDYLAHSAVRLTRAGRIPLEHLRRLDRRFSAPEGLKPRAAMEDSRRISWFLRLAEGLDLVRAGADGRIELQKRAEIFLDLDARTRLAIMIDGAWNRMDWGRLGDPAAGRLSHWAFEHRAGFAALLADLPASREWMTDPNPEGDEPDALLTRFLAYHRVVSDQLLFALRELGLLDATRGRAGAVRSLTLTRLGRRAFNLYARRSRRVAAPEAGTVESLRDAGRG